MPSNARFPSLFLVDRLRRSKLLLGCRALVEEKTMFVAPTQSRAKLALVGSPTNQKVLSVALLECLS